MYKLCKTEQSALRQRELEIGLLEAMTVHHFDEISVSDLCDRLNIPRKSFYRYFSGKDGALQALIDHTLWQYEGESHSQVGPIRDVQSQMESFFRFWLQHRMLLDALSRSGRYDMLIDRAIHMATTDASIFGHFKGHQDAVETDYATSFAVCGLMMLMLRWHAEGYAKTPQQMSLIAVRLLTQPLHKI